MAYTRPWPYPPHEATTIRHTSDAHLGYSYRYDPTWDVKYRQQMTGAMKSHRGGVIDGRVHTGDTTDYGGSGSDAGNAQDPAAKKWLRMLDEGVPTVVAPGNHDLRLRVSNTAADHSAAAWEHVYGLPTYGIKAMRHVNVLWFTPDVHEYNLDWTISDTVLNWADRQIRQSSKPVILANHYPMAQTVNNDPNPYRYLEPRDKINELIGSNQNVAGMLSGHRHYSPSNSRMLMVVTAGGRRINHVCAPSMAFNLVPPTGGSGRAKSFPRTQPTLHVSIVDQHRWEIRCRTEAPGEWTDLLEQDSRVATMDSSKGTVEFSNG